MYLSPAKRDDVVIMKNINEQYMFENYSFKFWENNISYENSYVVYSFFEHDDNNKTSIFENRNIVGYCLVDDTGHIISICIIPDYRNYTYGTQLLSSVLVNLKNKNVEQSSLYVRTTNQIAIHIYKSLGFQIKNIKLKYYTDDEDAYYMVKIL